MQYAHANFAYYLGTVTTVMACLATIFAFFISAIRIFDALIYMTKVKPADLRRCDVIAFTEGSISTIASPPYDGDGGGERHPQAPHQGRRQRLGGRESVRSGDQQHRNVTVE